MVGRARSMEGDAPFMKKPLFMEGQGRHSRMLLSGGQSYMKRELDKNNCLVMELIIQLPSY